MRLYSIIVMCVFVACHSKKSTGINLVVTEKEDTVSYFKYGDSELMDYEFFDRYDGLDNVIESKTAQSKLIGVYGFGFRDKTNTTNRLLGLGGVPISNMEVKGAATMPFLHEEFDLPANYEVKLMTNVLDSANGQPRTEIQIALDKISGDTLIYQESSYAFRLPDKEELILTLLIYDNQKARQDMLLFLDDVKQKINRYSNKTD